jgi:Undecaprenyl-phosphate galactose phosphotransferase WbaP
MLRSPRADVGAELAPGREATPARSAWPGTRLGLAWRPLIAAGISIVTDWLAVAGCLAMCWLARSGPLLHLFPTLGPLLPFSDYVLNLYGLAPWLLAFAGARLYTRRALFWDDTRQILRATTLAALFAVFLSFVGRATESLSRLVIAGMWLSTLVVLPVVHYQTKRLLSRAGLWGKRVLILGASEIGVQVYERIRANPALGYEPVAFVDDDPHKIGQRQNGLPVRGPLSSTPELVRELAVRDVVVAMPRLPREQLLHVVSICEGHVESIRIVPDMFGVASVGVEAEDLDGVLLLHIRWNLAKPWNRALKRAFDLIVATVAGVLLAPLLAVAALAIRLDSPGPVLFLQPRIGRGRHLFLCVKFRTMYIDNEERLRTYLAQHPESRADWERFAKLKSFDPRVTAVGRLFRRISLDELPQLVNVFRREMSLVGPRPYLPSETDRMGDLAETILKASPGATGLWQVSGRNRLTFEQRLRLDEYYVRNWSLWMDVVVLMKTIGAVIRRDGAY